MVKVPYCSIMVDAKGTLIGSFTQAMPDTRLDAIVGEPTREGGRDLAPCWFVMEPVAVEAKEQIVAALEARYGVLEAVDHEGGRLTVGLQADLAKADSPMAALLFPPDPRFDDAWITIAGETMEIRYIPRNDMDHYVLLADLKKRLVSAPVSVDVSTRYLDYAEFQVWKRMTALTA